MNMSNFHKNIRKAFHITDNEDLYNKLAYIRLLEIIQYKNIQITNFKRSTNNYGEFRFISLRAKVKNNNAESGFSTAILTAYGHGYNDCRECMVSNKWDIFIDFYDYNKDVILKKSDILSEIKEEHKKYYDEKPNNRKFSLIEDLTGDSDFAYSECFM